MTTVAFTLQGSMRSAGGYNYLLNLLRVVSASAPGQVRPLLVVGEDTAESAVAPFQALPACEVIRTPLLNDRRRRRSLALSLLAGRDAPLDALLQSRGADLVFEAATFLGWRQTLPALAWMPDFQHHFLPQAFSRPAWWRRELGFRVQVATSRTVMVSSEDSRAACIRHYPSVAGRIHVVRFAVPPPPPVDDQVAAGVAARHGVDGDFFFMPNQFWSHKNHLLVVQAMALLRTRGHDVTILAKGRQSDPRNPGHMQKVLDAVREEGLERRLLMPGMVPYEDLAPLMQRCAALINPSLFEGWSTSVEEARAAGVPMLLSDLDVHREQAEGIATFFDRHSAASLADALAAFTPLSFEQRLAGREAARTDAQARLDRFAADFVSAVHACAGRKP